MTSAAEGLIEAEASKDMHLSAGLEVELGQQECGRAVLLQAPGRTPPPIGGGGLLAPCYVWMPSRLSAETHILDVAPVSHHSS